MSGTSIHANCVVVGTLGLLIRGPSGSGKSGLSDVLVSAARLRGNLGKLVADDRVCLEAAGTSLLAHVPDTIAGRLEVRGIGLVAASFIPTARVHLVVTLTPANEIERLPHELSVAELLPGLAVPAVECPRNDPETGLRMLRWALRSIFPGLPDYI